VGKNDATVYQDLSFPSIILGFGDVRLPSVAAAKAAMNSWTA